MINSCLCACNIVTIFGAHRPAKYIFICYRCNIQPLGKMIKIVFILGFLLWRGIRNVGDH